MESISVTVKFGLATAKAVPAIARWLVQSRRLRRQLGETRRLLGLADPDLFSYRVGMAHPLLQPGTPHVDDLAAFEALAGPSIERAMNSTGFEAHDVVRASLSQGMVLIGSPEADALTRLIFGYEKMPNSLGIRFSGSVIDLPYRWNEDSTQVTAKSRRFLPEGKVSIRPNWPIVNSTGTHEKPIYPILQNDQLLRSDLLLITRLPNFLTLDSYQSGRSIISVGGTHGVGTRAVGLLLEDSEALKRIHEKLPARCTAFQVLAEAESIRHDRLRGSAAWKVYVRDVQVIERAEWIWDDARRAVRAAYTDWAAELMRGAGELEGVIRGSHPLGSIESLSDGSP